MKERTVSRRIPSGMPICKCGHPATHHVVRGPEKTRGICWRQGCRCPRFETKAPTKGAT